MDLVPIVLFLTAGAVLCAFFYFRYRARQEVQHTLRLALEQGKDLTPELLEALASEGGGGRGDLRKGLLWLAIAAGMAIMAWGVDEPDVLALAGFPLMLGIAYLGLWWFHPNRAA